MSTVTCPNGHDSTATDYCDVCGVPIAQEGGASAAGANGANGANGSGSGAGAVGASGAAPDTAPDGPASSAEAATQECPNCQTQNDSAALFCEACGYDFTTGTMPRPAEAPTSPPTSSLDLDAGDSGGSGGSGAGSGEGQTPAPPVAPELAVGWVAEVWVDPDWYASQESDDPCPSPGLPETVPLRLQSLLIGRPSVSRGIHPDIDLGSDPGVSRRQTQLTTDGSRWWVEDLESSNGTYVGSASGPLPAAPLPPGQRRELAEGDRVYVGAWTRLVVRRATAEEQQL
ncbi:FHA domain-containing protein [Pedococcus bigeumensis]|uniref:FHA domain-containing protein n=1 Tax=Pedococcus bigeumensis TaxID=433644 RepID=A0A502CQ45_9MICO|nr:FHA domain-containing protein [Pedococcus bigeumensis]TPG13926.1 FHA domain-containing protein [Pedococcus bigeumensis]